jgi:xanthine dehydrogenase accessory factor
MTDFFLDELVAARNARTPHAIVTVARTTGSTPRAEGSKMLVYADGKTSGTIGGGKFEALAVADAIMALRQREHVLKKYPLREDQPDSFGAICGGEVTVFIEPQILSEAIFLIGAGHCASAIAEFAQRCGLFVSVLDDRAELIADLAPGVCRIADQTPADFIRSRDWQAHDALVIVSRNHEIDREALAAAVETEGPGYIGMIGSQRKVRMVFDQLSARGVSGEKLSSVYAPIGLDIGADSPAEIAVSVIAEVLAVLRNRSAKHMRARDR